MLGTLDEVGKVYAFFRVRIEAEEQTVMMLQQTHEAEHLAAPNSWGFRTFRPRDRERLLKPNFRMDDRVIFRCRACGVLHYAAESWPDISSNQCGSWHKPIPLWIEQTRSDYKIFTCNGRLFA